MKKLLLIGMFVSQSLISPSGQSNQGKIDNPMVIRHCPVVEWEPLLQTTKDVVIEGKIVPATLSLCKNPYYEMYIVRLSIYDSILFVMPSNKENLFDSTFSKASADSFIEKPDFSGKKALILQRMSF